MESGSGDVVKRLETANKDLADTRLQLQQLEAKNKTHQESIVAQEKDKRQLEDDIDALNAKLAGLSRDSGAASSEAQQEHQKQMAQLRDQIALKNSEINKLKVDLFLRHFFN